MGRLSGPWVKGRLVRGRRTQGTTQAEGFIADINVRVHELSEYLGAPRPFGQLNVGWEMEFYSILYLGAYGKRFSHNRARC